jgi:carboxymethylenebutenolidase
MAVEQISFAGPEDRRQRAWLAEPGSDGPAPGVIVIHELYGLVENQQPVLDRFAAEGYVALAPDLYDRPGTHPLCVVRTILDLQRGEGVAMEILRAAQQFLRAHPRVTGERIGVVGFCLGGGFALLMALEPGVGAVAPFYGMSPPYLKRVADSCPVVASFGVRDMVFRKPSKGLKRALDQAGIEHDVKVYPDAGHSFMTADRPGMMHAIGSIGPLKVGYNPEAAEDSWERMLGFFDRHVRA